MEHVCPICNHPTKFVGDESSDYSFTYSYKEYTCPSNIDEHIYTYHVIDGSISLLQIRLRDIGDKYLYLRILYDKDIAEVWTKFNHDQRINIGKAFVPNFLDLDKLKNRIKLYLLMS